ncbi:actin-binding LIM protein 1 [Clonorchis sinensis]|uniref:Actin-binding LIM protein 1 n=1 Tax=Clonorchis sinensis TaxID=79923 RepID=G7Y9G5_CLOSI|nr:actin-binding LIM protein 1 [Clonorchis sinensis]
MFCVFRINISTRGVLLALVSIHFLFYISEECKNSLETGGFYMKDDEFYCQKDYHRYFVAKCKACAKDLIGELVTVLDFSFHRECFKCTSCSITFHPGDRVTVWQERFFCPSCVGQQGAPVPPVTPTKHKTNGTPLSPLSVTDDEGCCVSAADASLPEFPSPQDSGLSPCVTGNHLKDSKNVGEFRLPSSEAKCITSTGNPQKSKSILRKSGTDKLRVHESSREHGALSTDSGLGERVFGSKTPEAQINGFYSHEPTNGVNYTATPPVLSSTTLSLNNSRQSLLSRVPNSDYGRYLNQSYIHLNGGAVSPSVDKYKRNVSSTILNSSGRPKHFHLPESKSRFLPPGTRTHSLLFGQPTKTQTASHIGALRTQIPPPTTRSETPKMANSAVELRRRPPSEHTLPNGHDNHSRMNGTQENLEEEMTVEARRLACFPSGHKPDPNVPPPIERYDWPGPPASAVILAEMMRERRCKRREQSRVNGTFGDEGDDYESQEALSIDYSYDGGTNVTDAASVHQTSGIGQAILREQANEQKRRSRSHQLLDPISASRSPNAAVEPLYKPRYSTHQFASTSSGHPIKPGYTGGRLSEDQKTASLPTSSLVLLNSHRLNSTDNGWQLRTINGHDQSSQQPTRGILSPTSRPYYHSVHTLHTNHQASGTETVSSLVPTSRVARNRCADSAGDLLDSTTNQLSYPHVRYPPPPSAVFHKPDTPPPKVIPYNQLRTYRDTKVPRGIDRTSLESGSAMTLNDVLNCSNSNRRIRPYGLFDLPVSEQKCR